MGNISLLTAEEEKSLNPVIRIIHTVVKMHDAPYTTEADAELNQQMNSEFEALCRKRRLKKQKLLDLAVNVLNSKWFCVFLSGGDFDSIGNPFAVWSFITSDQPEIQKQIVREEYPDFFTINKRMSPDTPNFKDVLMTEYRSALQLGKEYKSISADYLDAVMTIYEVFGDNPRKITTRPISTNYFLADKITALKLFGLTEKQNKKSLFVSYDSTSTQKKKVGIGLKIDFDGVPANLTKSLTMYDKNVYNAVYTLYMYGYHNMTASMIYGRMGTNSRPSTKDIQRVNDSLTKMGTIRVTIDNSKEHEEYPSYPLTLSYDEILLDFVRMSKMEVNGSVSESAIRIKSEPFMGKFARVRNQIREIDVRLLNPPVNKSEKNLSIRDYLIYIISYPHTTTRKITHDLFFKRIGAIDRKQKQRALETTNRILTYYKKQKLIADYKMEDDGILIVKKLAEK